MIDEEELEQATMRMHEVMCGCFQGENCSRIPDYTEACIAILDTYQPPKLGFDHHASHVILELSHRCLGSARKDDRKEASRYAQLASDLEKEFPEAKEELDLIYERKDK